MSTVNAHEWLSTSLGAYVAAREQAYCDETVYDIFGFNALQLGLPELDLLRASRMPFRLTAGPAPARLPCDPRALPIASQSIDLVVLPHVLEFSAHPHQILREVERVLIPEGHLLLTGFNPISLWGACRLMRRGQGTFPWGGRFIGLPRLKDWLALLNFEVAGGRFACYAPPLESERWRERFAFLEAAGDRWWPLAGGVYFLLAKKRVHGMRIIMPKWQERVAAQKRFAAAAQQEAHQRVHDEERACA